MSPSSGSDVGLLYSQARFCLHLKTQRHSPVDGGMAKNTKEVVVVLAGCWLFERLQYSNEIIQYSGIFFTGNRIIITSKHASSTVGKKQGRGKLEPAIPGMTIEIPKSTSGDFSQSDSESDHHSSK